ncbi:thioredoxin family protein [Pedobacter sp. MC2016-24]|uniref:thioredoxin family protein n=1 Tax=Pedobacter sp. MC2016-24 TaxID=2780090 RepID=UPI00187F755B|nr:thioredoxin family protein [Pedobacter sp. MC2016-24]MBE9598884.1 thioredoxin family protein [Pedobacter sp. MC2016-24]
MINYNTIFAEQGISYSNYRTLIDNLLAEHKTTGPDNSDAMLHYTKMNVARMNRVDKTAVLNAALLEVLSRVKNKYRLLVISEGWCGDAAQIVPLFDRIVGAFPNHFDLRFVLRDQNLPLIDAHLTNGGRAIPVLLVLSAAGEVIAKWGPRPQVLQSLLADWKKEETDMMALAEKLHSWYAKDKTEATQKELVEFFDNDQIV